MRLRPLTNTDLKLKRNTFAVSSTAPIINFANLSNSALLGTAFVSRSAGLDFVSTHCSRTCSSRIKSRIANACSSKCRSAAIMTAEKSCRHHEGHANGKHGCEVQHRVAGHVLLVH